MRRGSSNMPLFVNRGRSRLNTALKKVRSSRHRPIGVEGLESRTLLATIPAAVATGPAINLSNLNNVGFEYGDSPVVAVNPYSPKELVAVWVVDVPALAVSFVEGGFSTDGGATWTSLPVNADHPDGISEGIDASATDPSVGFDSAGNVYVLDSQHAAVGPTDDPVPTTGTLLLSKFTFTATGGGTTLSADFIDNVLYQWVDSSNDDAMMNPVLAVDPGTYPNSGPATTPPAGITKDPHANNVYVAWVSNDIPDSQVDYTGGFNPNRIELIVSSDGGQSFSGVTTVNNGGPTSVTLSPGFEYINPDDGNNADFDTPSPQDNAHPQFVINSNDAGTVTVGWSNVVTGALQSNSVQTGDSYQAAQLTNSIGNFFGPLIPDPRGGWVQPTPATSIYAAGPAVAGVLDPMSIAVGDVNGDGENDIVVADNNSATGGIGVLLNQTTKGTFPASATVYPAGGGPVYVSLGDLAAHTTTTILDALVANRTGGVSLLTNGTPPGGGAGVFNPPIGYASGAGTSAVGFGNFDGTGNQIVAVNKTSNSVTILDPATGKVLQTLTSGLNAPTAVAVADFNGDGAPDIAVFNSGNNTIRVFLDESTAVGNFDFTAVTPFIGGSGMPANVVGFTMGTITGTLPDLVLLTNSPGQNSLWVLQNLTTPGPAAISLVSHPVADSGFDGTPVGVTTGLLSATGAAGAQDIAVVYAATGTNESMVAVFRNLGTNLIFKGRNFGFQRTVVPSVKGGDYDAGQTNPTAIAVSILSGAKWDDIIVANNDGPGTISVLVAATRPTPSSAPLPNDFPVKITVPDPAAVTGLTVSVALTVTSLADVRLTLIAPNGDTFTLAKNGVLSGTELGTVDANDNVNPVVFDDNATRDILDSAGLTPIIGNWRPQSDYITTETLDQFVQAVATKDPTKFNGDWVLRVTDSVAATAGFLQEFSLQFTTGMIASPTTATITPFGFNETIDGNSLATVVMPPALGNNYLPPQPVDLGYSLASPLGVGPGLVLAEDNTLGPNSPFKGRIYAAFVGYFNVVEPNIFGIANPVDNPDIFEVHSDDGGQTWSTPVLVNEDQSQTDGYSESNNNPSPLDVLTGRVQFQPAIAVDQATGTVVLSWRDGRDDPSRARVATYIATSIDGGNSFGPGTYANPAKTAVDAITGQTVVLGPESDNQSIGAPTTTPGSTSAPDTNFGYGTQMGLAVLDGQVYPVWAGDFNQGTFDPLTNTVFGFALDIFYRPMTIAAGPRVTTSTMGPIPLSEAASGAVSISVSFDRPITASTFTTGDVQVFYHDTTNGDASIPLKVTSVTGAAVGTNFTIVFDPTKKSNSTPSGITNFTGTYSYLIAPDNGTTAISSPIWSFVNGTLRQGDPMDQNADGTPDQNAVTTLFTGLTPGDVYATPNPQPAVPVNFMGAPSILKPPFEQNTLPLIVPGPQVLSTVAVNSLGQPSTGSDDLILNGTTSAYNLTFDRPIQTSTFTPSQVLQITGPAGPVTGPQFYPSSNFGQIIPAANGVGPGMLDSTLSIPSFDGSFKIAKITVELSAVVPVDAGLTAVLIAPDGTQVPLFAGVGGNNTTFVNTILDDASATSITAGKAPFTGAYRPTSALAALNGKTVDMPNPAAPALWVPGVWTLQLINASTATGMLGNWSVSVTPVINVTPVNPVGGAATTFQIGFPLQELSGTYAFQLGTGIKDTFGDAVDTNQNAGLDVLRGQSQNGPTATVVYPAVGDLPKPIPAPNGTTPGEVSSTITVPDSFLVQGDKTSAKISGLRVQVNISYPTDPDLTATLYYDMGTPSEVSVPLFSGVGGGATTTDFDDTVFDDNAGTPIQNGSAPFFATFDPQLPLSAFAGLDAKGSWTLVIQNNSTTGGTGIFTGWSLFFQKPLPTSGLGEPGSDLISASFRIFTLGQSDAMSSGAWTPVGAAATGSGSGAPSNPASSGEVTGLAIDPSDPSGNTVYAAGASGGVWKTTNFLTKSPNGPTWIPLTDFGPTTAVNIGSVTVFARNNNPNDTIVIAATGEGNAGTPGVGFLISENGGSTWSLSDSTVNVDSSGNPLPIESNARDRVFVGATAYKVVVDPKLTPTGQVIIYAALSATNGGTNGGIWRSEDTGQTWTKMLAGQATDVVLDADSGTIVIPDSGTNVQGNLQVVYAGMQGQGVFMSPNQGQVWSMMAGGIGNPLIVNDFLSPAPNVNPIAGPTPNGNEGRIELAVPTATGDDAQDPIYAGWLYAAVAAQDGTFFGLFETKDFGQNWTQIRIPTLPPVGTLAQAIPTNDITQADYPITGGGQFTPSGNQALTLAVDPTDPGVVYLGGSSQGGQTGLIRIDADSVWDAHALVAFAENATDAGGVDPATTGPAGVTQLFYSIPAQGYFAPGWYPTGSGTLDFTQFVNFIRNPDAPFLANATLHVYNYSNFTNNGAGAEWIPFDMNGSGYRSVATMIDPTTGLPRLIFGNDQGVWSVLDNDGVFETQIGSSYSLPDMNRNGNLQIAQFYYGAAQPSSAAALIAGALFYGSAKDNGGPVSDPNILTDGNITWSGPTGTAIGVGTDQQGVGSAYQFFWPASGGADTNFFQYIPTGKSGSDNYIGRTFGLLQASGGQPTPDPQWPFEAGANFAIDPVNSNDVVISSSVGRIFSTTNQGVSWFDIGDPGVFGSPGNFSVALAYGAPDPGAPEGIGNLGNFIYVGTQAGQIYVTQDGGGTGTTNDWINISKGLDGSVVEAIVTDPTRGSHAAYAVTSTGVFFIANSIPSPANGTPTWTPITGNIHNLQYSIFGQTYDPTTDPTSAKLNQAVGLTSIAADWRYIILNDPSDPTKGSHPVLYVGANSGVYQSLDNGQSWTLFPDTAYGAVVEGGNLPHAAVSDLDLSVGNIDANTGRSNLAGPYDPKKPTAKADPDVLLATTFGRGEFAINLAPLILGNTVNVDPNYPGTGNISPPIIGSPVTISGTSEITGFGNVTWITVEDITDPGNPRIIAGFNPASGVPAATSSNSTDANGRFSIPLNPFTAFASTGMKTIEVFATDDAGSVGNKVIYSFNFDPATQLVFDPNGEPPAIALTTSNFASPTPVLVDALDQFGNIDPAFNGPVTLSVLNNVTGLIGTTTEIAVNGIATFDDLEIDEDGTYKLVAMSPDDPVAMTPGLASGTSTKITIVGAAASLYIVNPPPTSVVAGAGFGLVIGADDIEGNPTPFFTGSVAIAILHNPSSGTLGGTTSVTVSGQGLASFTDLTLDKVGSGYTLQATSPTLTPVTTSGIKVTPAAAKNLIILPAGEPPASVVAGQAFAMVVDAEDQFGNLDTNFISPVTIDLPSSIAGTTTVSAKSGVVTFSDLELDKVGTYQLEAASAGLSSVLSTSVTVSPNPQVGILAWTDEPPGQITHGTGFEGTIEVEDQFGNLETNYNGSVTMALDSNPGGGVLGGSTSIASGGVADFPALTIDKVGNPYTLRATAAGVTSPDSTPINVIPIPPVALQFITQPPATTQVFQTFGLSVEITDLAGGPDPDFNGNVTVAIAGGPPGTTLGGGATTVAAIGGNVSFSGLTLNKVGAVTLQITTSGLGSITTGTINVTPAAASQLVMVAQPPGTVTAGATFGFEVKAEDQYGNLATSYNGTVTAALSANLGGATLVGPSSSVASGGLAFFAGDAVNLTGTAYTIQIASSGNSLTPVTTTAFNVTAAAATHLAISQQPPTSLTAGDPFGLSILVEDRFNNVVTTFGGSVAIALSSNPVGATLNGILSVPGAGGQAAFSFLSLDTAASGYTILATSPGLVSATTGAIKVSPGAASTLVLSIPVPTTMFAGYGFGLAVEAEDSFGNLATGFTGTVTLNLNNNPGNATLIGPDSVASVGGVANSHDFYMIDTAASGYTIMAASTGLPSVVSGSITVTPRAATQVAVKTQPPSSVASGESFGFVAVAEDEFNNVDTNFSGQIAVALPAGSGATLGGTTTVTASAGQAPFTALTLSGVTNPVGLVLTSTGLTGTTTNPVTVTTGSQVITTAQIAFGTPSVNVNEDAGTATLQIVRSGILSQAVSVTVSTSGGTAAPGVNYTPINQVVNFAAGHNAESITIPIKNVGTLAQALTVNVTLSSPSANASLGSTSTATLTILNVGQTTTAPPPVVVETVQLIKKKHQIAGIVIHFSGALNPTEAASLSEYSLVLAGKKGVFTGKSAKVIKLGSAVYNAANNTVTLTPKKRFALSKKVQLTVNGQAPKGLEDNYSRLIDGNHDGQPGGNAVAILTAKGATVSAVTSVTAAIDALLEQGALAGVTKPRKK
jgi:subtilisin-like proprotein convertase family protein